MPDTLIQDGPRTALGRPAAGAATTGVVRRLLESPDTYATTLLVWSLDTYGPECLGWHPTTLKMEIEGDYAVRLPKGNLDRLLAAIVVLTTDLFFKDAARFVQLANVLAFDDFEPDEFEPADAAECAWAVTEALLLVPPDADDPEPFSDEVRLYIGHALKEDGFVRPPDVLRIALGGDASARVAADWGADRELSAAIAAEDARKAAEIEQVVRGGLAELVAQLESLPLRDGSTAELTKKISATIRSTG